MVLFPRAFSLCFSTALSAFLFFYLFYCLLKSVGERRGGSEARLADSLLSGLVPGGSIIEPRLNDAPS